MSTSKITIDNITYTTPTNSILVGEISISTPSPDAIEIPGVAPNEDVNIILQKGDDIQFKTLTQTSPVRPFAVNIYDQYGQLCNKYEAGRTNNTSGTVKITSDIKVLLSNIDFPKVSSGQTYLVIRNYPGLESCILDESKNALVLRDLENLKAKVDTTQVVLVICSQIYKKINQVGIQLDNYFKKVYHYDGANIIHYFVEYLFGKSVAGSKPSFQGMLNFGENVNVVLSRFRSESNHALVETQVRRNGRIQINTENKQSSAKFFVMVSHKNPSDLVLTEEVTGSSFVLVPRTVENIPGITDEHFSAIMKGVNFLDKLNANKSASSLKKFVLENTVECIRYVCDSPLTVFNDLEVESDYSNMIAEYGSTLGIQIQQLVMTALNQNQSMKQRARRDRNNMMFNLPEMNNPFNYNQTYGLGREYSTAAQSVPVSSFTVAPSLAPSLSTVTEE